MSKFRRQEYEQFATHPIQGLFGLVQVVMNACARLQGDIVRGFRERIQPENRERVQPENRRQHLKPDVLAQLLTHSMLARLNSLTMPKLDLQPALAVYHALTLPERFETHIARTWESY